VLPDSGQLALMLARQIEGSGPISVAEYMRSANEVYYNRADPLGAEGDFITAPEISQMFGELVGLWLADMWMRANRPAACHYVELGPGRGTLAADALRSVAQFDFAPPVYFVETSEILAAKQMVSVPSAVIIRKVEDLPTDGPLLIVANEFFDALPIKQLIATHAGWRELLVARGASGTFITVPGTHNMDHIVPAPVRNAPTGSIYETAPEASGILYELTSRILKQGGALLVIDYGYSQPGLGSTLQALKSHSFADPFENPGQHDLTAHVNFMEMANLAVMRELRVSGPAGQGEWLSALGINQRADFIAQNTPERAEEIYAARDRLVSAEQMGDLFKVLAISSPEWPVPEGFETAV
jgi:NADH dehydrogenase [ubiquinone] 1 alpha subcomplex assembly factor 7